VPRTDDRIETGLLTQVHRDRREQYARARVGLETHRADFPCISGWPTKGFQKVAAVVQGKSAARPEP